jgi:hypothetical protein
MYSHGDLFDGLQEFLSYGSGSSVSAVTLALLEDMGNYKERFRTPPSSSLLLQPLQFTQGADSTPIEKNLVIIHLDHWIWMIN